MVTLPIAIAAAVVLLLPGLALAPSVQVRRRLGLPLVIVWALCASPALWALLLLWSARMDVVWGRATVWLVLLGLALLAWVRLRPGGSERHKVRQGPQSGRILPPAAAILILAIALALRFGEAEGLVAAPWVDGYHHTVITQLFLDQQGLPQDYRPYLEADGFDYHFGFHALAALLSWLSGAEARLVVLWLGQLLCALVPLGLLLLGRQLGLGWLGQLTAQAMASAWLWFPPYYLSWGRYTQLTGLLVLPAALFTWQAAWRPGGRRQGARPRLGDRGRSWDASLAALLTAGLLLTHYRVAAFFLLALALLLLGPPAWRLAGRQLSRASRGDRDRELPDPSAGRSSTGAWLDRSTLLWSSLLTLVLAGPWLAAGFGERLRAWWALPRTAVAAEGAAKAGAALSGLDLPAWVLVHHQGGLWLRLALLGLLVALLAGRRGAWALTGWLLLAGLLTWPGLWGIGQSWALPGFSLAISLWMPISLGVGWLAEGMGGLVLQGREERGAMVWVAALMGIFGALAWRLQNEALAPATDLPALLAAALGLSLLQRGTPRGPGVRRAAGGAPWLPLGLAIVGALRMPPVINEATVILRAAELPAAAWIRSHSPPDARFLVAQALWNQGAYRGVDGGYWLPLTAGRANTVPPAVYALRDARQVHALQQRAQVLAQGDALSDQQILDLMQQAGADWIYVGLAAASGPGGLTAERLATVAGLRERYRDDAVRIFQRGASPAR